jgi:hypothetical protein
VQRNCLACLRTPLILWPRRHLNPATSRSRPHHRIPAHVLHDHFTEGVEAQVWLITALPLASAMKIGNSNMVFETGLLRRKVTLLSQTEALPAAESWQRTNWRESRT